MAKLELTFVVERLTKNTVRFKEESTSPKVETLYIQKSALRELGDPQRIKITIEPA